MKSALLLLLASTAAAAVVKETHRSLRPAKKLALQAENAHAHKAHALAHKDASTSQVLKAQSEGLNAELQKYADKLEPGPTRDFLQTLRLCSPCNSFERIGEHNDGGYVMCTDGLDKGLVGAFSYGINGFDGWGMAIADRYKIPLEEFDCTNPRQPVPCAGCAVHFHSECILNEKGTRNKAETNGEASTVKQLGNGRFRTLTQQLEESGNSKAADGSLLLKIDVEAAEWQIFAEEPVENLRKFREIVVEYHWINKVYEHPLYLKAVKNIEAAGFSVAHLHGNNFGGGLQQFGEFSLPNVLEVTYTKTPASGCAANIPYHIAIDEPNNRNGMEIPDAVLPTSLLQAKPKNRYHQPHHIQEHLSKGRKRNAYLSPLGSRKDKHHGHRAAMAQVAHRPNRNHQPHHTKGKGSTHQKHRDGTTHRQRQR